MPQEFHVVRCYACQVFQVQQVKKISKWVCKMCGEKQSLKKEYGRGSGPDCRQHVQKLNMAAGESGNTGRRTQESFSEMGHNIVYSSSEDDHNYLPESRQESCFENQNIIKNFQQQETSLSRWQTFVADDDDAEEFTAQDDDSLPQLGSAEVTLSRPAYRGRVGRKNSGWKSGRKRRREDFDQDIDVNSITATHQRRQRPALSCSSKTSSIQDHDSVFPSPPKSLHCPPETAKQFSNNEVSNKVQTGQAGVAPGQSWHQKVDTAREVSKKQRPAESSCGASSKWGQFLQDSEDIHDSETEDMIDNRGHVPKPVSGSKPTYTTQALVYENESVDITEDIVDRGPAESSVNSKWGQFLQDSDDINENVVDNRGLTKSSCTAGNKWGQFLEDSGDINDSETEDMINNQGHVAKQVSGSKDTDTTQAVMLRERQFIADQSHKFEDFTDNSGHVAKDTRLTPALVKNRQQSEDSSTLYALVKSANFPNYTQSRVGPTQPALCRETSAHRFDGTKAQGGGKVVQNSENNSCLQPEDPKNVFSLEDEGLLDEVFQENW